jgi:hypothetical protein
MNRFKGLPLEEQLRIQAAIQDDLLCMTDDDFEDYLLEKHAEAADAILEDSEQGGTYHAEYELTDELCEYFGLVANLEEVIRSHGIKREPCLIHTAFLLAFVGRIVTAVAPSSAKVIDPVCGYGDLLAISVDATKASIGHGIESRAPHCQIAKDNTLSAEATYYNDHYSNTIPGLLDEYDLIVTDVAPSSSKLDHCGNDLEGNSVYEKLLLFSSSRLVANGKAILIVEPSLFRLDVKLKVLETLRANNLRISAAVYISHGLCNEISSDAYLVIIERGQQEYLFIGRLSRDLRHQDNLIVNFLKRKPKGDLSLGRLISVDDFSGYEQLEARDALMRLARDTQWIPYFGATLFPQLEILYPCGQPASLKTDSKSLFIRLIGKITASLQIETLEPNIYEVIHLKVNAKIASPIFLVFLFNHSSLGRLIIKSISEHSKFARVYSSTLLRWKIPLPALSDQSLLIAGKNHIQRLRAEIDEIEADLDQKMSNIDNAVDKIESLNKQETIVDWIETLPFPLASILWRHHASQASYRSRYETLIHFFEATAAFHAIVHMSAFMNDQELWAITHRQLAKKLSDSHLSFSRATFGTWNLILGYLSGMSLKLLKQSEKDENLRGRLLNMYRVSDSKVIEAIAATNILNLLQSANKIRNDWQGHSGAVGEDSASQVHNQLWVNVEKLRGVTRRAWQGYELVQGGPAHYRDGLYHAKCSRIIGVKSSPFEEKIYICKSPLEDQSLYLYDTTGRDVLKLQPLIKIRETPEKNLQACYIYSRLESNNARLVSYHFENESNISLPSADIQQLLQSFVWKESCDQ